MQAQQSRSPLHLLQSRSSELSGQRRMQVSTAWPGNQQPPTHTEPGMAPPHTLTARTSALLSAVKMHEQSLPCLGLGAQRKQMPQTPEQKQQGAATGRGGVPRQERLHQFQPAWLEQMLLVLLERQQQDDHNMRCGHLPMAGRFQDKTRHTASLSDPSLG